ncbi:hypothetical protein [Nonomuraea longispora]|uniref:hypothetical protein n=1 Tax=Nonomuraea longispora TaxID=1848320 RepID=UPI0014048770|nr:hypothetical protein [Nonomuraea longispora]
MASSGARSTIPRPEFYPGLPEQEVARRRAAQTAALAAGPAVLTGEQVEAMCRRLTGRQ